MFSSVRKKKQKKKLPAFSAKAGKLTGSGSTSLLGGERGWEQAVQDTKLFVPPAASSEHKESRAVTASGSAPRGTARGVPLPHTPPGTRTQAVGRASCPLQGFLQLLPASRCWEQLGQSGGKEEEEEGSWAPTQAPGRALSDHAGPTPLKAAPVHVKIILPGEERAPGREVLKQINTRGELKAR